MIVLALGVGVGLGVLHELLEAEVDEVELQTYALASTNPCESMIETVRRIARNVKRWRNGDMRLRWTAAGMLEAEQQFREIIGHPSSHAPSRPRRRRWSPLHLPETHSYERYLDHEVVDQTSLVTV